MSAPVFVDTNVLIYDLDKGDPKKCQAAGAWRSELWKRRCGRISFQVLQEFYVKVIQKWPAARDDARAEVRDLLAWGPLPVDGEMLERSWKIQDRYQLSFCGLDYSSGAGGVLSISAHGRPAARSRSRWYCRREPLSP